MTFPSTLPLYRRSMLLFFSALGIPGAIRFPRSVASFIPLTIWCRIPSFPREKWPPGHLRLMVRFPVFRAPPERSKSNPNRNCTHGATPNSISLYWLAMSPIAAAACWGTTPFPRARSCWTLLSPISGEVTCPAGRPIIHSTNIGDRRRPVFPGTVGCGAGFPNDASWRRIACV